MYFLSILSFLLFFSLSHQESYCGSYLPKDESTCDKYTNTSHICCHLTGKLYGTIQQMCYPFSREDYYKMSRSVGINGFDYKLKCGQTRGAACGDIVNPRTYKDCSMHSVSKNSCCYYSYKGTTNCVWLGKSDVGTMKYKDLLLICGGRYIGLGVMIVIYVMMIIW